MTSPTIAEILDFANLQMAAEAFLADANGNLRPDIKQALIDGNKHASVFTATQADEFLKHWEVLAQKANTGTGFSGTLFKNKETNELVMSFRSTEFIDDSARDNQATNTLEIKETGFAWGQLRDMKEWYETLAAPGCPLAGQAFSVTGYSLGGHLATAFGLMYGAAQRTRTVTFNGAGVGTFDPSVTPLLQLVNQFDNFAKEGFTQEIRSDVLRGIYQRAQQALANQEPFYAVDQLVLSQMALITTSSDMPAKSWHRRAHRMQRNWQQSRCSTSMTEVHSIRI